MKLNKIFKWGMVALILISVAILIWGSSVGFESNGGKATDVLLNWAYIMVGLAVASWVVVGLIVSAANDPKSLIKIGGVLVGAALICAVVYFLSKGAPAVGMAVQPEASTLKLTDTLLNLTYLFGAGALCAIVVGEIRMALNNRK